ncbi:uncharacterized protein LOC121863488 [Homarus americanus]|uniref:NACHT, LRR and PYD domains-containing protein 10-like 6 n=1 Tax=Homarus americanus TaxID=6706 RepID=A0A8J5K794_HOMAM|nr:uncharacterized protein LOC121863488 [Homarus americanus]KAG7171150.1 NACHT, LRR and PYD domains-containing protein 10-like 6 [Homarus americanus]
MAAVTADDSLRFVISQALKTTVRKVLFLVYKKKFPLTNPGKKPHEAVKKCALNNAIHAEQKKIIEANQEEKFDITTLCFLLKHTCGLSRNSKVWNNPQRIEGNIQKLKDLRNKDAHGTQEGCSDQDLEDAWKQMCTAVTNVLDHAGLKDHLREVEQELCEIQKPYLLSTSKLQQVREGLQNELEELYRSGSKTTLMPLVWGGKNLSFHQHVNKTYTKTRLTVLHDGIEEEVDGEDIYRKSGSLRAIILQGESGTGKTSLLRHYAANWRPKASSPIPALTSIDYLIFFDCTVVGNNAFALSDMFQEILPKSKANYNFNMMRNELTKAENTVMFMIDAFDERLQDFANAFKELKRTFPDAYFLVTSRPHCTQTIKNSYLDEAVVVTAHGFNKSCSEAYVKKLFKANTKGDTDFHEFWNSFSKYEELVTIPQLLCWSCWFWLDKKTYHLSTRGMIFDSITDFMLRKLCHIHGKRILATELPQEGQQWLYMVSQLAYSQAKHDETSFNESSPEIKKLYEEAKMLRFRPREALSSLMQCDSSQKAEGEYVTFQFLHDSHANFLVSHYMYETLQKDKKVTLKKLFNNIKEDRKKSVISFLVSLLYQGKSVLQLNIIQEELVQICKHYTRYFDINYYLELIEESHYNSTLIKCISQNIPEYPTESVTTLKKPSRYQRYGQLWLRPKEVRRSQALLHLLSHAKPVRLWLRLCEGPHADKHNSVRGHQAMEGNPVIAMELVSKAYVDDDLAELRLTDVTVSAALSWPTSLWWLSLERCDIKVDFSLPSGLLKLNVMDCTGLRNIRFPPSLKTLKLQSMDLEKLSFPNVENLVIDSCTITNLTSSPSNIKSLKLYNSVIGRRFSFPLFPQSLEHVTISGMSSYSEDGETRACVLYRENYMFILDQAIPVQHLQSLTFTEFVLSPEAFIDFFVEFQEKNSRCRLVVESVCELADECDEREIIMASILTSPLPLVTVKFRNETITNSHLTLPRRNKNILHIM